MSSNVIHLPRPRAQRPSSAALGFYVRVGHNDHVEMMNLIATGEQDIFGFVVEAQNINRHRALITEAQRRDFDVILDPKTQPMGFPGGNTESLAALPWGLERHHNVTDFDGAEDQRRAAQIVEFAVSNGFTQILGPTHVLSGAKDPWLRRDIAMMNWTGDRIANSGTDIGLVYSLALPILVLRQPAERRAVIAEIYDAHCDAIWLKVENFGDHATGEKTAAYIDACRDFHELGVPGSRGRTAGTRRACLRCGWRHRARRNVATNLQDITLATTSRAATTHKGALRLPGHALLPTRRARHD
jgi:hypothetical protein